MLQQNEPRNGAMNLHFIKNDHCGKILLQDAGCNWDTKGMGNWEHPDKSITARRSHYPGHKLMPPSNTASS
jgi:hypothetical protein